jgi:hypothetical protein
VKGEETAQKEKQKTMQGKSLRFLKAGQEIGKKSGRRKFYKICMTRDGRKKRNINCGRCPCSPILSAANRLALGADLVPEFRWCDISRLHSAILCPAHSAGRGRGRGSDVGCCRHC